MLRKFWFADRDMKRSSTKMPSCIDVRSTVYQSQHYDGIPNLAGKMQGWAILVVAHV